MRGSTDHFVTGRERRRCCAARPDHSLARREGSTCRGAL